MESTTDHGPRQQQQQQTAVRPHADLRRTHSPLYNYTALWARDLLPHASPDSSSSTNPLNPIAVHDRMAVERRRWTRLVCLGFLVCILANVASTVYVFVKLNADGDLSDRALLEQFMNQKGSADFLGRRNIWKNRNAYLNQRNTDGSSPHMNATPVAIHFLLGAAPTAGEELEKGIVTGWEATHRKYLEGVEYQETSGRFEITKAGIYQVYSQLSFTCPANEAVVQFKQELKDNTGRSLLENDESIDCSDVQEAHLPGHVSFMMSVLQLEKGRSLRLWTNQPQQLNELRRKKLSFFGIFKL